MAHLIRTLAFAGWVLIGTWIAPRMGTTPLEVAREQLQDADARTRDRAAEESPEREARNPGEPPPIREVTPPPPTAPVDASAGTRI